LAEKKKQRLVCSNPQIYTTTSGLVLECFQAKPLIGLPVAVGLEVAREDYKQLESFKQAQRSGYIPKRFQHGTLEVKYENVKKLIHPRQNLSTPAMSRTSLRGPSVGGKTMPP
jgi:hypothetical protein